MTQTKTAQQNTIINPIALPSADLVQYRFDQLDIKMTSFDEKLERLISGGISRADVIEMKTDSDKRLADLESIVRVLKSTDDRQQGAIDANKRFASFGLALLTLIVVAVTTYVGVHFK